MFLLESCPGSPQALKKPDDCFEQCKAEPEAKSEIQDTSKEELSLPEQTKVEPHEENLESEPNKTSEIIVKTDSDAVGDFKEDILAESSETGPNDSFKDMVSVLLTLRYDYRFQAWILVLELYFIHTYMKLIDFKN